jgi:putative flippase GtrA
VTSDRSLLGTLTKSRFLRFAVVGAAGFVVNEAALWFSLNVLGAGKYLAGIVAFAVAVTFTWWGNRTLTFADRAGHGARAIAMEWVRFVLANALGFAVNYSVYAALITFGSRPFAIPYVALGCGTIAGLVLNFALSSRIVFSPHR